MGAEKLGTVSEVAILGRTNLLSGRTSGSGIVESEDVVSSWEVLGVDWASGVTLMTSGITLRRFMGDTDGGEIA